VIFGLTALALTFALVPSATATLTATIDGDGPLPGKSRIVVANDDGSQRRILTGGEWSFVSPDGTQVAVVDYEYDGYDPVSTTLKVLSAAGGPPTFTMPVEGPLVDWAPDSKQLLVTDRERILLVDPATGAQRELVSGVSGGASLSPDMAKLAYVELPNGEAVGRGGGTLNVLDLATGATVTLARHAVHPLWGPSAIAFSTRSRRRGRWVSDVARIQPDGTRYRRLTRIRPTRIFLGFTPIAWSADGRRIVPRVDGLEGYWLNAYAVNAVRGGARLVRRGVMPTGFSRDGRYIIGQNGDVSTTGFRHGKIVRVPWRGGKPRVLLHRALQASYSG
jgi:hypothetical protein